MANGHSVKLSIEEIEKLISHHGESVGHAMLRLTSLHTAYADSYGSEETLKELVAKWTATMKEHHFRFDHLVKRRNEILGKGES